MNTGSNNSSCCKKHQLTLHELSWSRMRYLLLLAGRWCQSESCRQQKVAKSPKVSSTHTLLDCCKKFVWSVCVCVCVCKYAYAWLVVFIISSNKCRPLLYGPQYSFIPFYRFLMILFLQIFFFFFSCSYSTFQFCLLVFCIFLRQHTVFVKICARTTVITTGC